MYVLYTCAVYTWVHNTPGISSITCVVNTYHSLYATPHTYYRYTFSENDYVVKHVNHINRTSLYKHRDYTYTMSYMISPILLF
jgi:hypothetical protein